MSAALAVMPMSKAPKPAREARSQATERANTTRALTSAVVSLLPENFVWTSDETAKINALADELNCPVPVARRLLLFFLIYVSAYQKEFSVAELPNILKSFPV